MIIDNVEYHLSTHVYPIVVHLPVVSMLQADSVAQKLNGCLPGIDDSLRMFTNFVCWTIEICLRYVWI